MSGPLTMEEIATLIASENRYRKIEALHREGELDVHRVQSLIGKRCKSGHKVYRIERVHYGFDGLIHARGRRVLANDKLGSQVWDIGAISTINFGDSE